MSPDKSSNTGERAPQIALWSRHCFSPILDTVGTTGKTKDEWTTATIWNNRRQRELTQVALLWSTMTGAWEPQTETCWREGCDCHKKTTASKVDQQLYGHRSLKIKLIQAESTLLNCSPLGQKSRHGTMNDITNALPAKVQNDISFSQMDYEDLEELLKE